MSKTNLQITLVLGCEKGQPKGDAILSPNDGAKSLNAPALNLDGTASRIVVGAIAHML